LKKQQIHLATFVRGQCLALLALLIACLACSQESRHATTPGAEEEKCEVKVILRPEQIDQALQKLALKDGKASRRSLWFFDSRDLALFDHGVILRARKVLTGPDDSTVKMRPMEESAVTPAIRKLPGFKCEEDRNAGRAVTSCSLSAAPDRGKIDAVAKGSSAIQTLFDKDQERFLHDHSPIAVDWTALKVLGPIDARVWDFHVNAFEKKLTAELWVLPDHTRFFEISTRVPEHEADGAEAKLLEYLGSQGLQTAGDQATKTRLALQFFAGR
jgi:hypothetical protein